MSKKKDLRKARKILLEGMDAQLEKLKDERRSAPGDLAEISQAAMALSSITSSLNH